MQSQCLPGACSLVRAAIPFVAMYHPHATPLPQPLVPRTAGLPASCPGTHAPHVNRQRSMQVMQRTPQRPASQCNRPLSQVPPKDINDSVQVSCSMPQFLRLVSDALARLVASGHTRACYVPAKHAWPLRHCCQYCSISGSVSTLLAYPLPAPVISHIIHAQAHAVHTHTVPFHAHRRRVTRGERVG